MTGATEKINKTATTGGGGLRGVANIRFEWGYLAISKVGELSKFLTNLDIRNALAFSERILIAHHKLSALLLGLDDRCVRVVF